MSPITVTLQFASEVELVAFFSGKKAVVSSPAPEVAKDAPGKSTSAAKPGAPAPTQRTAKEEKAAAPEKTDAASAPSAAPAEAAPQASTAVPERATVSAAIVKLATRDKERALGILGEFGAKAGKELKDDQLADCYAKVQAALEG